MDRTGAPVGRWDTVSPVGLTAMAAVLHLVVLAGRVPLRSAHGRPVTILAWQAPAPAPAVAIDPDQKVPSNPTQSYCAGRLELTTGMAVLALATWLHIMRTKGSHAH